MQKVKLKLAGLDGNAFVLLGKWASAARQQGWSKEDIDCVCQDAMSGDYEHLIRVLSENCENNGMGTSS